MNAHFEKVGIFANSSRSSLCSSWSRDYGCENGSVEGGRGKGRQEGGKRKLNCGCRSMMTIPVHNYQALSYIPSIEAMQWLHKYFRDMRRNNRKTTMTFWKRKEIIKAPRCHKRQILWKNYKKIRWNHIKQFCMDEFFRVGRTSAQNTVKIH